MSAPAIRINLLDWRQDRRDGRRREFMRLLGLAVVVGMGLVMLISVSVSEAVSHQAARNAYLKQQIADTEQKIKAIQDLKKTREGLLARMRVIEQLQTNRTATVRFFDELVNTLPDGVTLTGIRQINETVTLEGLADSNGSVSAYMRNLDRSTWFDVPKLVVIRASEKDRHRRSEFTLEVRSFNQPEAVDPVAEDDPS